MRRIFSIIGLLTALVVVGAIGFRFVSGNEPWIDCFYMAVITITTVGYREAVPLGTAGKLFVMVYLFCGLGVFTYTVAQVGEWIVSTRVQKILELRRMQKRISKLRDHFIVCGGGRMGLAIASHLHAREKLFVVIDRDEEVATLCEERDWVFAIGDATLDEVLQNAGVAHAASLATVLPTDADNLYVTLSARLLNENLQIVARASEDGAAQKLERAGANRVISPVRTGAQKIARFMMSPNVEDFLAVADDRGNDLELADFSIADDSELVGQTLQESRLREQGVMVIGIRRKSGELLMPPGGSVKMEAGDCLFIFGNFGAMEPITG